MNNSYSVTPFCHRESGAKFCQATARRITKNKIFHFVFRILHHNKRGPGGLQCFSILYFVFRPTVWIDLRSVPVEYKLQITNYKTGIFQFLFCQVQNRVKKTKFGENFVFFTLFCTWQNRNRKNSCFVICNLYSTRKGLRSIHTVGRNTKYKIEKHCNPPGHRLLWWRIRNTKSSGQLYERIWLQIHRDKMAWQNRNYSHKI